MSLLARLILAALVIGGAGEWFLVTRLLEALRPRYLESMEASMVDTATILAAWIGERMRAGADPTAELRRVFADAEGREFSAAIYAATKTSLETSLYVTDERGIVIFDSYRDGDEGESYAGWSDVARTLRGEYGARTTRLDPADPTSAVLHVAAPVMAAGAIVGVVTVRKPSDSVTVFVDEARRKLVAGALVLAAGVAALAIAVLVWVTRPIAAATRYVEALARGEPAQPPAAGPREIVALGAAFDAMVQTIEGRRYGERHLQALIHEMKSPLSSIRGAAELLREDVPADTRARFLDSILNEVARLRDLVERQLQLAALEARQDQPLREALDLRALVDDVVVALAPLAAAKRLRVVARGDGVAVAGERFLVRQAIANLAQNAIDFAPADSVVEIDLRRDGDQAEIAVSDRGPGVPDFARDRVFDRFYSLPRPDTGRKGTGLGLTFVREIARLHGGSATVSERAGGGAVARLRLPG